MNYQQFENWLKKLSEMDRRYLSKQTDWEKEYRIAQKNKLLSKGFVEKTMEILEGGSESET